MFEFHYNSDCIQAGPNTFVEGVPKFWRNFLRWFFTWKYWYLALQNIFKSLGLGKNAKNPKKGKNRFLRENSKTVRLIFLIFWHKTPITNTKWLKKKFFQKLFSFLRKCQLCKSWNFSKTRILFFMKFKT